MELKMILEDICPGVDFEKEDKLIDNGILDSLMIITLISEIEDNFDVVIPPVEIVPDNFNSLQALTYLINRLKA